MISLSLACGFPFKGEADEGDQALPLPRLARGRYPSRGKRHDRHHRLSAETTAAIREPSHRRTLQVTWKHSLRNACGPFYVDPGIFVFSMYFHKPLFMLTFLCVLQCWCRANRYVHCAEQYLGASQGGRPAGRVPNCEEFTHAEASYGPNCGKVSADVDPKRFLSLYVDLRCTSWFRFSSVLPSQEQYDFCYRVVQDFVDIFSDYANFKWRDLP